MRLAPAGGARLLELFLFALSSAVLYYLGVGVLFFLIPLQVVAARRGAAALAAAEGLFVVMLAAVRLAALVPGLRDAGQALQEGTGLLAAVEGFGLAVLLLGLLAVNAPRPRGARSLVKALAATAAAGLLAAPLAVALSRTPAFGRAMEAAVAEALRMIGAMVQAAAGEAAVPAEALDAAGLLAFTGAWFLRSFLAGYLALLAFSWWAGNAAAARSLAARAGVVPGGAAGGPRLSGFRLDGFYLWPFIASWAGIGLGLLVDLGWASYVVWNAGLVMLLLYGLQGLAILRFFFEKRRLPRLLWFVLLVGLVALAASPRAGIVVVFGVPLFGVSENWIRYRDRAVAGAGERKE
jgi:hypothetical protein